MCVRLNVQKSMYSLFNKKTCFTGPLTSVQFPVSVFQMCGYYSIVYIHHDIYVGI